MFLHEATRLMPTVMYLIKIMLDNLVVFCSSSGDGEFVEVILLPLDEFQTKIDDLLKKEKIVVDAKVYIFAMGMVQAFFKPRELPILKQ